MKTQKVKFGLTRLYDSQKKTKSDNKSKQKNTDLDIYIHNLFYLLLYF